jgi:hypothetical protein
VGVRNHFSSAHELWQNGPAEASINSIMLLARTVMVESGFWGKFWFRAAVAGKDARNSIFMERIKTLPHNAIYGEPKDVSRFRAFCCKAVAYLNKDHQENGKHIARGIDAVNLGFASNTSAYIFYIPERKTLITTNQVKFDESEFPFRKAKMVEQYLSDNSTDILFQSAADVTWVTYNKFHVGDYEKAHHDKISDVVVLQIN